MAPERYDAAIAILQSFALQLGESAHRLLFATATNEPEAVRNAKSFIHQHLAEPMSLEAVAKAVNVSPFHFCKLFKRATGLTFTDFVNRARVEKAKRMLMKPAARITEVPAGTVTITPSMSTDTVCSDADAGVPWSGSFRSVIVVARRSLIGGSPRRSAPPRCAPAAA